MPSTSACSGCPTATAPAGTTASAGSSRRARTEADGQADAVGQPAWRRQTGRVVGEVGVDLDERLVALVEPDREAVAVRGAEARPWCRRSTSMPPSSRPLLLGDVGGAVRAVVVDDENVDVGARRSPPEELVDVLRLDVGRGDDERAHVLQLSG